MNPKKTSIGDAYNAKENSIGFLRFILAIFVVIQHSFVLNNMVDPLTRIGLSSFGSLGVNGFFILSGYLITASWLNSKSFLGFSWRRLLRIFPAFWVCLLIISFIIAPILAIYQKVPIELTFFYDQLSYIYRNFLLLIFQQDIGNLMSSHPESSLNGSLWTLSWEFGFYMLLAVAGVIGFLTKRKEICIGLIAAYIISYWLSDCKCTIFFKFYTAQRITILPFMFGVGVVGYLFKHKIPNSVSLLIICLIGWFLDIKYNPNIPLYPFFFLYIILWLVVNLPVRSFEKHGDYSYGIYIYHFPLIQLILTVVTVQINSWLLSVMVLIPTVILAFLSWHYVEKPALSFKKIFL
jgi:peptidoglycan/LPS O-acetylase OafA/YrhL